MTKTFLPGLLLAGLLLTGTASPAASEKWGTVALGKAVGREAKPGPPRVRQKLETRFRKRPAEGKPTVLFREGEAQALLVVPKSASRAEMMAAELLRTTLGEMTGATFTVVRESETRRAGEPIIDDAGRSWAQAIWIGQTAQAAKEGLSADDLKPEGYRLATRGPWLFVLGRDLTENGLRVNGTYFGAANLLERHLGVRWLWPGKLGSVIPKREEVALPPLDEQDEPALAQRTIRNMAVNDLSKVGLALLHGEADDYRNTLDLNATWLRNQGSGSSVRLRYGHAYGDWYERYAKTHPDWFALQPNGSRQQHPSRVRLCKSNPEVAHEAARRVLAAYAENPGLDSVSISPNDGGSHNWFCMCGECRKLDPPDGEKVTLLFARDGKRFEQSYPSLTNRFVTFYNRIAEEVAETLPHARLGAYAYSAYRDPPLGIRLHPSIVLGFVGLNYINDEQRRHDLERWDGWAAQASTLILRPNAFHSGDALPLVYPHRLGEDVKHCYQTGMVAADFDALIGNWSTQGLNYYVLAKLLWDPSAEVDAIVADYCRHGFGPAAETIARYFATLEEATRRVAQEGRVGAEEQLREEEADSETPLSGKKRRATLFHNAYFSVFTPAFLASLRDLLQEADGEARGDETVRARIAFLRIGLDYAELYRRAIHNGGDPGAKQELLDWHRDTFRRQPLAVNSVHRLWRSSATFRGLK
ncbi:MAG TPA: DUF4838 domain-containing protein [Chthoniobacteraceae bacterium]|nr:DUF4838 domain-containing protein [Chthoniobacteraceae bacterium]